MKLNDVYSVVHQAIDGEKIRNNAIHYRQYPIKLSYSSYAQGIEWLANQYRKLGLEAEVLHFPADGHTVYADRHFPFAWDVSEAWAKSGDQMLADYSDNPYGVVPFSADSNGVQKGIIIPVDKLPQDGPLDDLVPLILGEPSGSHIAKMMARGCKAFLVAMDTHPVHPSLENSRRWFNAAFGAGQIDYRDKACSGFSITPATARDLTERMAKGEKIEVEYLLKSKTYSGDAPAVTACIPGEVKDCFIISSHGYEPHGTNNVSGIGTGLEIAETIMRLIKEGKMPKPKYTIRLFHGFENFSLYAWGIKNPELMKNAIGGVSLDSFGRLEAEGRREHFVIRQSLNIHPSPQHAIAHKLLKMSCNDSGIGLERREASKNNEDLMQDPQFGPAWNLLYGSLWEEPIETYPRCYFYHTSNDTAEKLSPVALKTAADFAASLALFCSQEQGLRQEEQSTLALDDWKEAVTAKCMEALSLKDTAPELRTLRAQRLAAWRDLALKSGKAAIEDEAKAAEFQTFLKTKIAAAMQLLCGGEPPKKKGGQEYSDVLVRTIPGPVGFGLLTPELREIAAKAQGYLSNEYWCLDENGTNYYHFDGEKTVWQVALATWGTRRFGEHENPNDFDEELTHYSTLAKVMLAAGLAKLKPVVTVQKEDIRKGLSQLGIKAGDTIMVHSSLKSLGRIPGGAMTVIEALEETVGENGILAMPGLVACADGGARPPYNPKTSAIEPWVGIIPETFRNSQGVLRSSHPTHSVCAWGKDAADFVSSPTDPMNVFAEDGPWGKLLKRKGKLVFIGESIGGNTFLHATEAWILGYLDETFAWVETPDGGKEQKRVTNYPGGCRGGWYNKGRNAPYFKKLLEMGVPHAVQVGQGVITMMDANELFQAMKRIFKEDPYIMLHKSGCADCARIRGKIVVK